MKKDLIIKIIFVILLIISIYFIVSGLFFNNGESNNDIYEDNLILSDSNVNIIEGDSYTVTATVTPENTKYKKITWDSTNPKVATVNDGVITGVSAGDAIVKATTEKMMITKIVQVKVVKKKIPVEKIEVENKDLEIFVADQIEVKYTIIPDDATNKNVSMKSSDTSVVAFMKDGKIVGVSEGDSIITISCDDIIETINVHVKAKIIEPTKISLDKKDISIKVNESSSLKATIEPDNATDKSVIWESSDESIASVDQNGNVKGLKVGNATITTKTNNNISDTCNVTVLSEALPSITDDKKFNSYQTIASCNSDTLKYRIIEYSGSDYVLVWASDPHKQLNAALAVSNGSGSSSAEEILAKEIKNNGYGKKCMVATNASFFNMSNGSSNNSIIINKGKVVRNNGNVTSFGLTSNNVLTEYVNKPLEVLQKDGIRNNFGHSHRINPTRNNSSDKTNRTIICQVNKNNFVIISGSGAPDNLAYNAKQLTGVSVCFNLDGGGSRKLYYKNQTSSSMTKRFGGSRKIPDMLYFVEQ